MVARVVRLLLVLRTIGAAAVLVTARVRVHGLYLSIGRRLLIKWRRALCSFGSIGLADVVHLAQLKVRRNILAFQVLEQLAAACHQRHQTAYRVLVLLVGLAVLGQVANTLRERCHLRRCRARVVLVAPPPCHGLLNSEMLHTSSEDR